MTPRGTQHRVTGPVYYCVAHAYSARADLAECFDMVDFISRRRLLGRVVTASVGVVTLSLATSRAGAAGGKVCADLDSMDSGAKSMRASLNYTEASADAAKTCGVCAFFQMAAEGCGTCQIFSGPANPRGHCDSWSQKG